MEALNYKCPCCGAGLAFSADSGKWDCASCKNTFELETLKSFEDAKTASETPSKMTWQSYAQQSGSARWADDGQTQAYECPSCGAEIVADGTTAATKCLYCGSPTVLAKQLSGAFRPDCVVPFQVGREKAQDALRKFSRHKPLLPKGFEAENRVKEISGAYIPYWLFDCEAEADITYDATNVHTWREGDYQVTRTDHFLARRRGGAAFENLPVDGSTKFTSEQTESIEPFDLKDAVDFSTAYLSGFVADKYDEDADACAPRANERVEASTKNLFRSTLDMYETATPRATHIDLTPGKIRNALLPVWLLNSKYRDKMYDFQVNGQTGRISGNLPVSKGRYFGFLAGIGFGLCAFASVVCAVLMKTGVIG